MPAARLRLLIASALSAGVLALAGCGGSDDTATTAAGGGSSAATTAAAQGDAAAGKTVFETTCQACHLEGGTKAGAGPVLAGKGLTVDAVTQQVQNPRNQMPPNLVSGKDLDDVAAYVVTIE